MYKTALGDTFAKVARKVYGTETLAPLLVQANPGVFDPLPSGVELITPDNTNAPVGALQGTAAGGVDEVALTILGRRFRFWDGMTLKLSIDSVDTLELTAPFEPDNEEFRQFFRPFTYPKVTLSIGSELVFTGTQIAVKPGTSAAGRAVSAASYSLPGVLNDCCPPAGMYADDDSLEFEGQDLRGIATILLKPFGLVPVFTVSPGAPFELVAIKASDEIMPFLSKLAKQRALVITSNAQGEVVFWQSNTGGNPVARLMDTGNGPLISIDPNFESQNYYSHITGIDPTTIGADGGQFTVKNNRLPGVLRPYTFETTEKETNDETLPVATEAKVGRMFGDAVSYNVELSTWRDAHGTLWKPNTTIIVEAPGAMIYKAYEFLIKDVTFKRNTNGAGATLTLVLIDAYRGKIPEVLPWDS